MNAKFSVPATESHLYLYTRRRQQVEPRLTDAMSQAGIPQRYQDVTYSNPLVMSCTQGGIPEWITLITPPGLYLSGPSSIGKTLTTVAYCRELLLRGIICEWWVLADLAGALRRDPAQTEASIERLCSVPHLFLDDLAADRRTDWWYEILYRIVNRRYNDLLPTTVTTNTGTRLDDRIQRRLLEESVVLEF